VLHPVRADWEEAALPDWEEAALPDWEEAALPDWEEVALPDWEEVALPDWEEVASAVAAGVDRRKAHWRWLRAAMDPGGLKVPSAQSCEVLQSGHGFNGRGIARW